MGTIPMIQKLVRKMRFSFSFQSTSSLNFFYVLLMFNFCDDLHSIIITLLQETNFSEYKNYKYKLSCQNLDLLYFYVRILTLFFPMFPFDSPKNIGKTRVFCGIKRKNAGFLRGQKGTLRWKGLTLVCTKICADYLTR